MPSTKDERAEKKAMFAEDMIKEMKKQVRGAAEKAAPAPRIELKVCIVLYPKSVKEGVEWVFWFCLLSAKPSDLFIKFGVDAT